MVQTGAALALIGVTLLMLLALYYATIKYVSAVLYEDEEHDHDHEGTAGNGGHVA